MPMQDAFRQAFVDLKHHEQKPHVDPRNLRFLQAVVEEAGSEAGRAVDDMYEAKLMYGARRLARHWCSYARPNQASPRMLDTLRDEWVLFARQLRLLGPAKQILLIWEVACAMKPGNVKYDGERFRYLIWQASTRPDCFVGLTSSTNIPWPGPAPYFIHAVEELEDATPDERQELHQRFEEHWENRPLWLIEALVEWLEDRSIGASPSLESASESCK